MVSVKLFGIFVNKKVIVVLVVFGVGMYVVLKSVLDSGFVLRGVFVYGRLRRSYIVLVFLGLNWKIDNVLLLFYDGN